MVLLDTHVLLWMLFDEGKLSHRALETLKHNDLCISIASIWELAIKTSLEKLKLPRTLHEIAGACDHMGIDIIGISLKDCECLQKLPWIHRDPFDRIIVSHAIAENIPLVTHDANIHRYSAAKTIW